MENLTEETIAECKQAFNIFDKDGSGSISAAELSSALNALGQSPSEEDIARMLKEIDKDDSGEIDFNEFLTMMASKMREVDNEEEIQEAFKVFDTDSDGYITAQELMQSMQSLNEAFKQAEIDEMIKIVGTEGRVSYSQFKVSEKQNQNTQKTNNTSMCLR